MKRAPVLFVILLCALSVHAQLNKPSVEWQPIVEMDSQLFPSYILATATTRKPENSTDPTYLGDVNGAIGISVIAPSTNADVKLVINANTIAETSTFEGTLDRAGQRYEVFPEINYRYGALSNLRQPMPLNINFELFINDKLVGRKTKTIRVRSVNECPTGFFLRNGRRVATPWMFAAYVNEDHPWIDQLLREALNAGTVSAFIGYQGSQDDVYRQIFSIWNVLQRRGFRFSSITTTSIGSSGVSSQYVRFLEDAVRTSEANCIDGSVLFASIFRRIGLDPMIVLIPGHAFVGVYLDRTHRMYAFLETTMMGNVDLRSYSEDGSLASLFGAQTRNQVSWKTFNMAIQQGNQEHYANAARFRGNDGTYFIIEIAAARKAGIAPITH